MRELYAPSAATASAVAHLASANHAIQIDRLLAATGTPANTESRLALGAWLAFVEYAARNAVDAPDVPREQVLTLCVTALEGLLGRRLSTD